MNSELSTGFKKLRAVVGRTPRWAKYLQLAVVLVVLAFSGIHRLELVLIGIAGVAYIEWRDFASRR
jgi:hypothetical protein